MSNYFGTGTVTGHTANIEAPVYEGFVAPTGDALMKIATEGVLEGAQLQAALHIADATIAYTAVHESAGAAEAVLESVIGSTVGKIKEGLKKLWAKIKAWFASVKKSISVMFSKGKDFISKYKKEIEGKTARGFEYDGHVWTVEKGAADFKSKSQAVQAKISKIVDGFDKDLDAYTSHAKTSGAAMSKDEYSTEDLHEEILGAVGANKDLSEVKQDLAKEFRNGEDDKEELKEFSKVTRSTLISLVKDIDKNIKTVTDVEKEIDKTFTKALKVIDKVEAEIGKADKADFGSDETSQTAGRAKATTYASKMAAAVRYGQAVNSALASTAVDSIKAAASEAESVLKSFIRFRGVKESIGSDEPEVTDVMESLLSRVGF